MLPTRLYFCFNRGSAHVWVAGTHSLCCAPRPTVSRITSFQILHEQETGQDRGATILEPLTRS